MLDSITDSTSRALRSCAWHSQCCNCWSSNLSHRRSGTRRVLVRHAVLGVVRCRVPAVHDADRVLVKHLQHPDISALWPWSVLGVSLWCGPVNLSLECGLSSCGAERRHLRARSHAVVRRQAAGRPAAAARRRIPYRRLQGTWTTSGARVMLLRVNKTFASARSAELRAPC